MFGQSLFFFFVLLPAAARMDAEAFNIYRLELCYVVE
jgi:hypothetical protein